MVALQDGQPNFGTLWQTWYGLGWDNMARFGLMDAVVGQKVELTSMNIFSIS